MVLDPTHSGRGCRLLLTFVLLTLVAQSEVPAQTEGKERLACAAPVQTEAKTPLTFQVLVIKQRNDLAVASAECARCTDVANKINQGLHGAGSPRTKFLAPAEPAEGVIAVIDDDQITAAKLNASIQAADRSLCRSRGPTDDEKRI